MTILIADDNADKRKDIIDTLHDCGIYLQIEECENLVDTKRKLRENSYDILLLDIKIPMRDGSSEIIPDAGIDFFNSLKFDKRYNQPREVIGITAYEEQFLSAKKEFDKSLFSILHYEKSSEEWRISLLEKIEYIKISEECNLEYNFDIAIVCALKEPELEAVLRIFENCEEYIVKNDRGTKYYHTEYQGLKIVFASAFQMGMPASSILTMKIINIFKPEYLFMTGICAGIEGAVNLGDIIIPELSWDYGSGKIKEEDGKQIFEVEPYPVRIKGEFKSNVEDFKSKKDLISSIQNSWQGEEAKKQNLQIHIGPMASGASVVADEKITQQILDEQHRKLIGIEMEAYAVMYAAEHCPLPQPKVMVAKSVCDFANSEKNDKYHEYAAYTSASFIFEYIKLYCMKNKRNY